VRLRCFSLTFSAPTFARSQKKAQTLYQVNPTLMTVRERATPAVGIRKVEAAELDEMWSFVGSKKQPRWLWGALDHQTGRVVAYAFGRREDQALLALKALLAPLGIRRFFTDGWGAYRRHLDPHRHVVGKRRTQQLERKHLTLHTRIKRLVRKTLCFSRSAQMLSFRLSLHRGFRPYERFTQESAPEAFGISTDTVIRELKKKKASSRR
jgi:insertion element IS1 protein InsB